MPGLEFRYVGQDRLPARLSDFDVERYFALTDSDIAAINERFRRDRLPALPSSRSFCGPVARPSIMSAHSRASYCTNPQVTGTKTGGAPDHAFIKGT